MDWNVKTLRFRDGTKQSTAGNGGSQPLSKTFTAAEIAAAWDADDSIAAMEWTNFPLSTPCLFLLTIANTLDQGCVVYNVAAFTPGATSAQVWAGGDFNVAVLTLGHQAYESGATYDPSTQPVIVFDENAAAYVVVTGSAAPTTGSVTVYMATV